MSDFPPSLSAYTEHYCTRHSAAHDLAHTLLHVHDQQQMENLLRDICTEQELDILRERWEIAKLKHMGFSYRTISAKTGASSATIARVAQNLVNGSGELLRACQRRQEQLSLRYG